MITGIIFEIKNGKASILKNNGEFISVKAEPNWKKGEIISIRIKRHSFKAFYRIAACLLLFLLCGGGYSLYFTQNTIISLDVNPSLEISLNRFDRVISYRARNKDGLEIINSSDIKNMNYKEALTLILKEEERDGYLKSYSDIVFTVYSETEEKKTVLLNALKEITGEIVLADYLPEEIEYHTVDEETIRNAHNLEVTAGKYLYLEKLKEASPNIAIENYCHHSIDQIKDQISACEEAHGHNGGETDNTKDSDTITDAGHHKRNHHSHE